MGFFYSDSEPEIKVPKGKQLPYELLHEQRCKVCPQKKRWKDLGHPQMEPTGARRPVVYILGEAPGEHEDVEGIQFIGKSGELLRRHIPEEWESRIRWNNTIRCRPPANRAPLPIEVECCRGWQKEDIEKTKPLVVVAVGGVPLRWAIEEANKISSWRGLFIPFQLGNHTCWLYPILHPAGVLRQGGGKGFKNDVELVFSRDLERLFRNLESLEPPTCIIPKVDSGLTIVDRNGGREECELIERKLAEYEKQKEIAIDFETQGLRPYHKNAKLLCASLHSETLKTFAFPITYPGFWKRPEYENRVREALVNFFHSSGKKVAHNAKFEQEWALVNLGVDIDSVRWEDTQAMAYILDNRRGMMDLDTQTRLYLGFWLKALSPPMNKSNMQAVPLTQLLRYNSLDTKWLLKLRQKLLERLELEGEKKAGVLRQVLSNRVKTGVTLAYVQRKGMPVNQSTVGRLIEQFKGDEQKEVKRAEGIYGFRQFKKKFGRFPGVNSNPDMEKLFGEILDVRECRTEKGGITTGDEVLGALEEKDCPEAKAILNIRRYQKVVSSFLVPLQKDHLYEDGKVHCTFNHLYVDTSRLSSEEPNMQNQPKRRFQIVRSVFEAPKGYKVVSVDYGAIEARCIAMASRAKYLVDALWNDYDVHAEWSRKIYAEEPDAFRHFLRSLGEDPDFNDPKQFKKYRDVTKNKLVFPLFFGSSEKSVGPACHLTDFASHKLVEEFWEVFREVKDWHRATARFYEKNGYVQTLFGFRRYEPMGYNQQINTPIQGTAGELVLRAGNRLRAKHKMIYNLNVHDDLTFILPDKTLKRDIDCIAKEMVAVKEDFVNVPLIVEVKVGQNWYEQEDYGVFSSNKGWHK